MWTTADYALTADFCCRLRRERGRKIFAHVPPRLGKDEREVRRILDPSHATKLPALKAALAGLGRRLVVGVEPIAA